MSSKIFEYFGFIPSDNSPIALKHRSEKSCPFVVGQCIKKIKLDNDPRHIAGVCSMNTKTDGPVMTCPHRMYAGDYAVIADVALAAFGKKMELVSGDMVHSHKGTTDFIAVFGQRWGKELRLPKNKGRGSYSVDWILARLSPEKTLLEFTAMEVQTIDTTGNYHSEVLALSQNRPFSGKTTANLNWENVNKRILPQIIYKGHVLRREPKCSKGLYFICPTAVYNRIHERLGGNMQSIHPSTGTVTFMHYSIGGTAECGSSIPLTKLGVFTATVDEVALAFTAPKNLPAIESYEHAILSALLKDH